MPADFKLPPGSEYQFNSNDPALAGLRQIAHEEGWTQQAFSKALGQYAAVKLAEETMVKEGFKAEVAKLGPTGPSRVDNILQWMQGIDTSADKHLAKAAAVGLITAPQVEFFEAVINRFTTQGGANFSQSHRVPADDKEIPGYEKMDFAQKRAAQDQRAARRTA